MGGVDRLYREMSMKTHSNPLAGKAALVTGGSRSLGAAIAKRLAADGAAVALRYLASPEAGFITGASLLVDGGYTA
jgi:NAD(P)-dependent dehydrogenase (short-subunit alcohol dehydrogenase family)